MRKFSFIIFLATAIFAACNNNSNSTKSTTLVVASETDTVKYQCPMKCQGDTAFTTVGLCSVCEMDLERM